MKGTTNGGRPTVSLYHCLKVLRVLHGAFVESKMGEGLRDLWCFRAEGRLSTSPVPMDAGHRSANTLTKMETTALTESGGDPLYSGAPCGSAMAMTPPLLNVTALTEDGKGHARQVPVCVRIQKGKNWA